MSLPLLLLPAALAAEPAPAAASPSPETPAFAADHGPIPDALWAEMDGVTWREGCPVGREGLARVTVSHHTQDGGVGSGTLIVAAEHAPGIVQVFAALWEAGFVVQEIAPAHTRDGDDPRLMADNVTSAFNCRPVAGTGRFSEHAYGRALDLNPLWNPYVRGEKVQPESGRPFVPRDAARVGTITAGDAVVAAFSAIGWRWGGTWRSSKDYQHFSSTGR